MFQPQEVSVPQQAMSEMGVGLPQPALVKNHGRERHRKCAIEASGGDQEDEYTVLQDESGGYLLYWPDGGRDDKTFRKCG